MLRGTKVRVSDRQFKSGRRMTTMPKHLIGTEVIALERMKNSGYIKVLSEYDGYLTDLCYPEEILDIIELPVEL